MAEEPTLAQLRAFEAVVRRGTTLAAAAELGVTQGAVSKHLAGLERALGVGLFRKAGRHLEPRPEARDWAAALAGQLAALGAGVAAMRALGAGLVLAVPPGFGAEWLAPRLGAFRARHPEVGLTVVTRLDRFDLGAEGVGAAVHVGAPDWPGAAHLPLWEERVLPCVAPSLAGRGLGGVPLLALESRAGAWAGWGVTAGPAMRFDQFAPMIAAAEHGLGAVLLPDFLAAGPLAAGRLVALAPPRPSGRAYWLVWPEGAGGAGLRAFRDWLLEEVGVSGVRSSGIRARG